MCASNGVRPLKVIQQIDEVYVFMNKKQQKRLFANALFYFVFMQMDYKSFWTFVDEL